MQRTDVQISFLGEEKMDEVSFLHQEIVDVRSKKGILFGKKYVRKAIEKIKPDSIHIQQINRLAYFTAQSAVKLNIPYVATAWGSDVLLVPEKSKVHYNLTKYVLENAIYCTADSDNMIDVMKEIAPIQNYVNLNFGVEFKESNTEKENYIYSNRLHEPLYQIDKIIRSFQKASVNHPDWKLKIGGKGSLTDEYKLLVKELGISDKVEFVGWLSSDENWSFYHKSKIYCSIPKSDGTAISLLEAMFAKCYPVVWDLPVAKEWIDESSGMVVHEKNEDFISKAISNLTNANLDSNKELVVSKADKSIVAHKFLQLHFS